jgi:hypothetical protein
MRCNCESGHCAHHHGDPADIMDARPCAGPATGEWSMALVGYVCEACALTVRADATSLITRTSSRPQSDNPA